MLNRFILRGFILLLYIINPIIYVYADDLPIIHCPHNHDIISYVPYKIVWTYSSSFFIHQQLIRFSQDPHGNVIHLQRILEGDVRDFVLQQGLADNRGYYLSLGYLKNPGDTILWSSPIYFILDHLNSPPEKFMIKPLPDTLKPGIYLEWTSSIDPDPLDSLLRYILFIEDLSDSSLQKEILYLPEKKEINVHAFDISPYLINHKKYRIRVFAEDFDGLLTEGTKEQTFIYFTGKNISPSVPIGLKPFNVTELSLGDTLQWNPSYDSDGDSVLYTIQLDSTPVFLKPLSFITHSPFFVLSDPLKESFQDDDLLYWHVQAHDLWGGISSWSTFGSFYFNIKNTPPYWPIDIHWKDKTLYITQEDAFLQWPHACDDDYSDKNFLIYHIIYASKKDTFFYKTDTNTHKIPVQELKENETYTFKILVEDKKKNCSDQCLEGVITINCIDESPHIPPRIIYPPDHHIMAPTGRLAWTISRDNDPLDTLHYLLMISEDSAFQKSVYVERIEESKIPIYPHIIHSYKRWDAPYSVFYTNNPDTFVVQLNYLNIWDHLKDNQRYFYKVQAVDKKGLTSLFSLTHTFILNKYNNPPEPVTEIYFPQHMSNIKTIHPVFSWKVSDDPDPDENTQTTRYQLYIREIDDTISHYLITEPGECTLELAYPFRENGRYTFKIRSFDTKSVFSAWSDTVYFWINQIIEFPHLDPSSFSIQPDSIITTRIPIFLFGSVRSPDPPEEQQEIFMDIRFIQPESKDTILYESLPFTSKFSDSTLSFTENSWWTYQIRLKIADTLISNWTKPISFGVDTYADIPLPFYLLRPKAGQDTVKVNPTFQWTECVDPDIGDEIIYTLYLSKDSTFYQDTYIITDIKNTHYTFDEYDLEDNTKYFWKVSAKDKDGHIIWGSNSNFESRYFIVGLLDEAEKHKNFHSHEFHPVQPNPFKDIVNLTFTLGQSEEVTISIYNIIGQQIEIIHHGIFPAGTHTVKWDITQAGVSLPAGVYIFTLKINNKVLQQKGLYLK
ncbi:MAG: T9SS type A sorting domain-containing protein [Candidatus Marinimicrobia bacterium]|nr:T9SS type A sorting domain-containing protein [Candidatus Neomarinimicrobiota bacterium]MDD5581893.1 T9SS type A sorting domain-containing protein [Candidatus Neomarinimicrobiota bacterium]